MATPGSAIGATAAMIAPVSVPRVYQLEVPVRAQHRGGVAYVVGETHWLGFRSSRDMQRYRASNAC